ncbi:MAG: tetratricopeptide repeat protein [Candidatus Thermoplasmatota archaeon]|nr:tetratricopeptide repeat protein [Candidatus Thermoplasmatota archaeon]
MNEDKFFRALENGDGKKAEAWLKRAGDSLPRARLLYLKGLLLENKGDLGSALKKLNMALVLHLSDPSLWLAKAKVLAKLGRMEMAKRAVSRACKLSTGDPAANLLFADILYKMKDFKGASEQIDIVLDLAPMDPEGLTLKGILVSTLEGDYRKALGFFDSAIGNDEDHSAAWTNRGIALRQIGDRDGAIYSFQKALLLDPGDKVAREMLEHMGAKKFIVRSAGKPHKKKWSRSRYMTDARSSHHSPEEIIPKRKKKVEKEEEYPIDWEEEGPSDLEGAEMEDIDEFDEEDPSGHRGGDLGDDEEVDDWDIDVSEDPSDIRSSGEEEGPEPEPPHKVLKRKLKRKVKKKEKPEEEELKKKKPSRSLRLTCPDCDKEFEVKVSGPTNFKCPGCGLHGEIE